MAYLAADYFKDSSDYYEFRSWLLGRLSSDHMKVED